MTKIDQLPKIVKDADALRAVCEPVVDIKEGEAIAKKLFEVLTAYQGAGLSAPQIGINKRVFVVNTRKPLYFINPKIEGAEGQIIYVESCLSFPVFVRTKRHSEFKITADNMPGGLYYDVSSISRELWLQDPEIFEMVAIQHEYDHLDGVLMFDKEYKLDPVHVGQTIGRNEKVKITDGKMITEVKYKKAEPYLKTGHWKLVLTDRC